MGQTGRIKLRSSGGKKAQLQQILAREYTGCQNYQGFHTKLSDSFGPDAFTYRYLSLKYIQHGVPHPVI